MRIPRRTTLAKPEPRKHFTSVGSKQWLNIVIIQRRLSRTPRYQSDFRLYEYLAHTHRVSLRAISFDERHYYEFRSSLTLERRRRTLESKRLGRTQDPTILVLTSLTGGPKHGYAIIKDIEEMTGTVFGPGTLYGVLVRLEEEGLIAALPSKDRRRPYRITGAGSAVLTERLRSAMKVATIGLRRLGEIG